MRPFRRIAVLLALCALALGFTGQALAVDDRDNTTPTAWWFLSDASATDVSSRISAGYRITDLEVIQTSPSLRFAASFARNSGSYQRTWWWYYNLTSSQVSTQLSANGARLIDLERYVVGGVTRFAAVMVSNSGVEAKAWWYYYARTPAQISSALGANGARLVDIERAGSGVYDVVMIKNAGADAKAWWYYYGRTTSQISSLLSTNSARLVDLEPTGSGTYDVIMVQSSGTSWWWYTGTSASTLLALANQNGARLIDVERYRVGFLNYYAGVMITNVSPETTRVNELMRSAVSGTGFWGQYLKRSGGGAPSAINQGRVFEPASMIKVLFHLKVIRQYQSNLAALSSTMMTWYTGQTGSCPTGTGPTSDSVSEVLRLMMQNSDNRATDAIVNNFGGRAGMNTFASSVVGLSHTSDNHKIGCAADAIANPNTFTLTDATKLYERASNGDLLNSDGFAAFRSRMLGGNGTGLLSRVDGIIQGRAAGGGFEAVSSEATAVGLDATKRSAFKAAVKMSWKAGSYGLCLDPCQYHWTMGGWISIPFKNTTTGTITNRQYLFGWFTNGSSTDAGAKLAWDRGGEVLRQVIRSAMLTWKAAP